ncbi:MAG: hypothetical protein ATN36_04050 [Epulopiscium sp. Nele67-Bin005]|nr:MAG: hypothetical protein ATN36_04050 [Epulopiscium sp. Nele67-Bin005]
MFKDFTISKKLISAVGIIILISVCSNIYTISQLVQVKNNVEEFYQNNYYITQEALDLSKNIISVDQNVAYQYIDEEVFDYYEGIHAYLDLVDANMAKLTASLGANHPTLIEIANYLNILKREYEIINKYDLAHDYENLDKIIFDWGSDYNNSYYEIKTLATQLHGETVAQASAINKSIINSSSISLIVSGILLVLNIMAGSIINLTLSKAIVSPISELEQASVKMSQGDFGVNINYTASDELGILSEGMRKVSSNTNTVINDTAYVLREIAKGNFNVETKAEYVGVFKNIKESIDQITKELSSTIRKINVTSHEVNSASNNLSSSATILAQGAIEQSATIQQLSATFDDISQKIFETTNNAHQANTLATTVGTEMEDSNKKMKQVVSSMNNIAHTNNEISSILKSIDDIAFQTNLLALNAAIEANRAGESGQGFAVVAEQVRELAQKSAEAAKDSATLISSSIASINEGNTLVLETATSLDKVYDLTHETVSLINTISNKSEDQATALKDVVNGIEQISLVIRNNTVSSKESATASDQLNLQATELQSLISAFELK